MRPKLNFHFLLQIKDAKKVPSKMEVAPHCTQKLKVGRKLVWILKLYFWVSAISRKFSRDCVFSSILEKNHFSILTSMEFHSPFHFSKEWNWFLFHFSLLEPQISTLAGHWSLRQVWSNFRQTTLVQCHKVSLRSHFLSSSILVFWFVNSATSASFHTCHHQVNPIFLFFFWKCSL